MTAMLEQIRVGWNRRRRSTDPVNLLYPFEVDRIHVVRSRPRHPDAHAGPITQMHLFFSRLFAPRARAPEGEIIYAIGRSEERRGGKECVSTCRSRGSPCH